MVLMGIRIISFSIRMEMEETQNTFHSLFLIYSFEEIILHFKISLIIKHINILFFLFRDFYIQFKKVMSPSVFNFSKGNELFPRTIGIRPSGNNALYHLKGLFAHSCFLIVYNNRNIPRFA